MHDSQSLSSTGVVPHADATPIAAANASSCTHMAGDKQRKVGDCACEAAKVKGTDDQSRTVRKKSDVRNLWFLYTIVCR